MLKPDLKITCDSERRCFLKNGEPFFYLADTAWQAFALCSEDDFEAYCRRRAGQGFTVLQMSVFPLDKRPDIIHPFCLENGKYDFTKPNKAYFEKANRMLDTAISYGLLPCLHLYWNSLVPDDWGSEQPIPQEELAQLTHFLLHVFADRTPFWSVSGDTRFETPGLVRFYLDVLDIMAQDIPDAQVTFHLNPPYFPPQEILDHPMYTFRSYQSGHEDGVFLTWIPGLSEDFLKLHDGKPLINNEMCYERIGRYKNREKPFTPADLRQAIWLSMLSGASAGFTYGAHGIWQCRQPGGPMSGEETWGPSVTMMEALLFRGAEEASFAAKIFKQEKLFGMIPADCVFSESEADGKPKRGADLLTASAICGNKKITFCSAGLTVETKGHVKIYDLEEKTISPDASLGHDRLYICS